MKSNKIKYRYPGIRAFEIEDKKLFFGRKDELRKLFSLVKSKPLVVVFAKSGIGKSSLINAGLIPLLRKKEFQAIKIRLQDPTTTPVNAVKQAVSSFIDKQYFDVHLKTVEEASLWECMRACKFKKNETSFTPILIFDQFEEFFDHDLKDQEELKLEIANLVSDRLPLDVQEEFRKIPRGQRTAEQKEWYNPFEVKIVFAIRSDRIHRLDELSDDIPIILHDRFHLKPMQYKQAREAIIAPALLSNSQFDTPPFTYSEKTLEKILNYLGNKDDEIESFQLQLICQNIEKKIKEIHG